jgi:hypothetical protein
MIYRTTRTGAEGKLEVSASPAVVFVLFGVTFVTGLVVARFILDWR